MPIYFCDSLKDVSILNGVARLEFQRLEAVCAAGSIARFRAVCGIHCGDPDPGARPDHGACSKDVRDRLVLEGIFNKPAPAEAPETARSAPVAERFFEFLRPRPKVRNPAVRDI